MRPTAAKHLQRRAGCRCPRTPRRYEVRVFLIGDAASAAHRQQKVPSGYYNLKVMFGSIGYQAGVIGVCGTCMDARSITAKDLTTGAHRSSLDELAQWTARADKALVF